MKVARRSRMVRVSVDVEEPFLESLRDHELALAHDVAGDFLFPTFKQLAWYKLTHSTAVVYSTLTFVEEALPLPLP